MGWRFRKRISIIPGIRLNLSRSGVSTSIGRPGYTVNLRGNRVKTTVGIPGSGLSYQVSSKGSKGNGHHYGMLFLIVLGLLLIWALTEPGSNGLEDIWNVFFQ